MKIYLLEQDLTQNNYEQDYYSVVVIAENEIAARQTHPSECVAHHPDGYWYDIVTKENVDNKSYSSGWVKYKDINKITVTLLGEANEQLKKGVIVSAYCSN